MGSRRWVVDLWAEWDPERDPALIRGRGRAPVDAPGGPIPPEVAIPSAPVDTEADLASLADRFRAGDLSVRERLAALLARLR